MTLSTHHPRLVSHVVILLFFSVLGIGTSELRGQSIYRVGDLHDAFLASEQTDTQVDLADYADRPVLINYCTEWCAPCNQLSAVLPAIQADLHQAAGDHAPRFLEALFENVFGAKSDLATAQRWSDRYLLDFPILHESGVSDVLVTEWSRHAAEVGPSVPIQVFLGPGLAIEAQSAGADFEGTFFRG